MPDYSKGFVCTDCSVAEPRWCMRAGFCPNRDGADLPEFRQAERMLLGQRWSGVQADALIALVNQGRRANA